MRVVRNSGCMAGVFYTHPRLLKFKSSNKITDKDIDSLFSGTLRLLKIMISESVEKKYIARINSLEMELKKYKERAKY